MDLLEAHSQLEIFAQEHSRVNFESNAHLHKAEIALAVAICSLLVSPAVGFLVLVETGRQFSLFYVGHRRSSTLYENLANLNDEISDEISTLS